MRLFNNRAAMINQGRQRADHPTIMRPMNFHFEMRFPRRTGHVVASALCATRPRA
jgi:hypothetical protein